MVVEELDGTHFTSGEGEHSAAASRDGDRAGSFAENEGFAGYDFNGNRTAQPMFRPKSPHAKGQQRKVSMEMNSQLRLLREQHMQEGGVLAEAIEEERLKREQMELEKRREMLRKSSMGSGGEVTNTPMAAEALVNMFNIPGRENEAVLHQDSPDWQGVSHMGAGGQSQPQVQPVGMLNENLNNDDDEFGGGFEAGDDDFDQEDLVGGQFADDRAFDEEGFPIRKPRGEAHKRLREEMARRKSLAFGGLQTIVVEDLTGGSQKVRKSSRQRQKPLEYWRGEKKVYERVHGSLPTIKATQRQTRNKMWPRKTPGGPSETFRVLKLRPTEQFNKIGAERRDSLDQLMTARNGAPLHNSDDEDEEIWDVDGVEFDQHGRRIKTFAKTPKEYYGRNGRATPNYNNINNNGSGKKKRGRPRKNPTILVDENDDDDGQQQQHREEEQNEQVRGKHIRLAPDTDDEEEEDERDDELEENTRRNSEAIHNNNHDDKEEEEEDQERENRINDCLFGTKKETRKSIGKCDRLDRETEFDGDDMMAVGTTEDFMVVRKKRKRYVIPDHERFPEKYVKYSFDEPVVVGGGDSGSKKKRKKEKTDDDDAREGVPPDALARSADVEKTTRDVGEPRIMRGKKKKEEADAEKQSRKRTKRVTRSLSIATTSIAAQDVEENGG